VCLKYNIIDITPSQEHTFEYWDLHELEADTEAQRYRDSRYLTETLTETLKYEKENEDE